MERRWRWWCRDRGGDYRPAGGRPRCRARGHPAGARRRRVHRRRRSRRRPGSGIKAAEEIVNALPATTVVMLTVSRDDDDLFAALRAGASGYLLKDTDPGRLPFALRGVLEGEAALPRGLVARLIEEFRTRGKRRRLPLMRQRGVELTDREWEVLEFLHDGLSTAEIADRLSISPVTVRRHVSEILKKLRVTSREEAVKLMEEAGGSSE